MSKYFMLFVIRVINKILSIKGSIKSQSNRNKKNALISYVLVPTFYIPFYFKSSHNNKYQCYLLVRLLEDLGYNVSLHYYLDLQVDTSKQYDLFIGHNETFAKIARLLKQPFKKILIAAGSEPNFGNAQQENRIIELNNRKHSNFKVYEDNIVPDLDQNYKEADLILLFGNSFVKHTYPENYHAKMTLINNVTLHPFFKKNNKIRTNNFLFISSIGQVHRGLDLLLDVFPSRPNKLYVLSAFEEETEFVTLFQKQLYETENIEPVGYLDLNSKRFKKIIDDVDFVILPSCSEGQSSSIVNMIAYGLIPVIPLNVGLPDVAEIGILIETLSLDGVSHAIDKAIGLKDEEMQDKRAQIDLACRKYSPAAYIESLKVAVT